MAQKFNRKYREYQRLFLEFIKSQWADGQIQGEVANAQESGKAQLLIDMTTLDYDDIRTFFIEAGHMKEREDDRDSSSE